MRNIKHKIIIALALTAIGLAQSFPPPTSLITIPTAGSLTRGSYSLGMRIQDEGGMIGTLEAGITDRFQFGLSFGSPNLIGDDSLKWYPRPEALLKYQLFDESMSIPGIAFGVNTQGLGDFVDSLDRYETKAYGVFFVGSKNWKTPFGNFGFHSGVNYNFTEKQDDEDINYFFGLDMELNPEFSILVEYNPALNENDMTTENMSINKGGYLNAAIRWTFVEHLHLEINFNNLLFDEEKVEYFKRELKITYIEYF
ncbi:MAG: TonB-dependent receptor [Candidatus Marinimicrobia bacterium]|nr:TonB-dependent receptor [Candidatus Neomarinimicrobiota bacterium]